MPSSGVARAPESSLPDPSAIALRAEGQSVKGPGLLGPDQAEAEAVVTIAGFVVEASCRPQVPCVEAPAAAPIDPVRASAGTTADPSAAPLDNDRTCPLSIPTRFPACRTTPPIRSHQTDRLWLIAVSAMPRHFSQIPVSRTRRACARCVLPLRLRRQLIPIPPPGFLSIQLPGYTSERLPTTHSQPGTAGRTPRNTMDSPSSLPPIPLA